jgi:short-subunit dehydrogenase
MGGNIVMYNQFSLKGEKIFVTGASSGIGWAVTVECSKMDAELVITARNEERLNKAFHLMK